MKKLLAVFGSVLLVSGLTACTDPRVEFDALILKAEQSLVAGDIDLAQAYVDEASAILPDSPVAEEFLSRVRSERKNQAILDAVERDLSNESWISAIESLEKLKEDQTRLEKAMEAIQSSLERAMARFQKNPNEIELGESLLVSTSLLATKGRVVDQNLQTSVYDMALEERTSLLIESLNSNIEDAITQLNTVVSQEIYLATDIEEIASQITGAYEKDVIAKSKKLVGQKDLDAAQTLLLESANKLPYSNALKEERQRVAGLIEAKRVAEQKALEEAKKRAVRAMFVKEDTFNNIKWYYDRATYSSYARDEFLLYMGQRGTGTPWLKLRFMMFDESWHFFERIVVNVDGTKYEFNPGYSGVKRDNGGGDIWEWYDHDPSSRDFEMIEKIIESKSTRIRYINDDNFYEERTVSSAFKKGLSNVLLAYEALGGRR